ncbi:uncharacterized protein [Cherax quadricarinatus]|uniref:uncharacterized protein n=1 Tax=Cherax quadricarinatus TaxID=27406 RepID=UPI00387E8FD6
MPVSPAPSTSVSPPSVSPTSISLTLTIHVHSHLQTSLPQGQAQLHLLHPLNVQLKNHFTSHFNSHPSNHTPSNHTPSNHTPSNHTHSNHTPSNNTASNHTVSNHTSSNHTPSNNTPSNHTPSNNTPSNHTPSNHTPSNNTPSNHTPSNHTPSNHTPSNHTPSNHTPINHTPINHTPINHTPSNHIPSYHAPSNHTPSNNTLSNHTPTNHIPSNHIPGNHIPGNHTPSNHNPSNHTPGNYTPTILTNGNHTFSFNNNDTTTNVTMDEYINANVVSEVGLEATSSEVCSQQYQREADTPRLVLLWTPFWHNWTSWKDVVNQHGRLRQERCPVWRCEFVWSPEATSARILDADAVVFFSLDFPSRPLPRRSPRHQWIWLEMEAPSVSQLTTGAWATAERNGVFFNLTMSYHSLNHIVIPNGYLLPLDTPPHCPLQPVTILNTSSSTFISYSEHMREYDALLRAKGRHMDNWLRTEATLRHQSSEGVHPKIGEAENEAPMNITQTRNTHTENYTLKNQNMFGKRPGFMKEAKIENSDYDNDNYNYGLTREEIMWASRRQLVAWMASHCPTVSRRESLVAALQTHISVTTVGKCGELTCGRNHMDTYCFRWLAGSHLFYLAFENDLCEDYHTEKLWRPLEYSMVPVVYGGPSYEHLLPFGSYINVMAFSSAEALSVHLVHLANHPTAYLRHLQWKKYWRVRWPVPWCNLCAYLHQPHHNHHHTTLDSWWNSTTQCYDPLMW